MSARTAVKTLPSAKSVVPAQKVSDTPAAVDWSDLAPAVVVEYSIGSGRVKVDREETTPTIIKSRLSEARTATLEKGDVVFKLQPCGSAERAEEFMKLARLYVSFAFEGYALRGKVLTDSELNRLVQLTVLPADTVSGSVVSFAVAKRTQRAPVSDEVKAARAAKRAAVKAAQESK